MQLNNEELVISFSAAILTEYGEPVGLAFRFVTENKNEVVVHMFADMISKHVDLFSVFRIKRERTLTDENLKQKINLIGFNSSAFRLNIPTIKDSDFESKQSRSVIRITYNELSDGVVLSFVFIDESLQSLFFNDYLVYKMLEFFKRFITMAGVPGSRSKGSLN